MSLSSWQVVPGSSLVPRGQLKNSASSSWDHLLVTPLGYRKTVFSIHSVSLTCFTFKARLQSKWGHSVTVYNVHGIRKLVPTFSCPSLCFRKPGLCFELCTVWKLYFLTGLCLGFHLPGAPGFPCERYGMIQTFRIFGEMNQALHTSQNNLACCICVQTLTWGPGLPFVPFGPLVPRTPFIPCSDPNTIQQWTTLNTNWLMLRLKHL